MPDSMQIDDYTERVRNPSDFATLRQKHIDGMYTSLEQFESDVYTVFKKAITINDHNTIPYKQAIFLQDQAKQVFQSIKNYNPKSKSAQSAWPQKCVRGRKKLRQNEETAPPSFNQALSSGKINNHICSKREVRNLEGTVTRNEHNVFLNGTNKYIRNVQLESNQNFCTREEPYMMERRLTYLADNDTDFGIVSSTFGSQNPYLTINALAPGYQESLCNFTKNAGMFAQVAAEERCQVYKKKAKDPYFTRRASVFPQISNSSSATTFDSTRPPQFFHQNMTLYDSTNCKLETNDLLKWFRSIGTPEFIQKGNAVGMTLKEKIQLENKDKKPISQQQITDLQQKGSDDLTQKGISSTLKQATGLKDKRKDIKFPTALSSFNGVGSSQLGFSQYASSSKSFKPDE
ncbi:hypothetical protein LUZ61_003329 [Rhynchospora tenuis]|uniref:Bromo domain-containing protein n=1 Tax=Rhynchospora tenuis TaxID=198213 RepID=A0AAD6ESM8_9POAL|nr:hypothetical protein LUZ61_003329 [Rhynchospora tenuis]